MDFRRIRFPDGNLIVVAVDICSSSDIMEQLLVQGEIDQYHTLIGKLKERLAEFQLGGMIFDPYKFMGDGWILLFDPNTKGYQLLTFMRSLCEYYKGAFERIMRLEVRPADTGIKFGIDIGQISRTKIFQIDEYVGRPINVACRLQGATERPYQALVTSRAFARLSPVDGYKVTNETRNLRNINDGADFPCMQITLME